jgi:hypothetical protein
MVDHYVHVIRIFEGCCAAIRWHRQIALAVMSFAESVGQNRADIFRTSFGSEIKRMPPFELSLGREWHFVDLVAANEIAAYGDLLCTVLATAPRRCLAFLAPQSNPATTAFSVVSGP